MEGAVDEVQMNGFTDTEHRPLLYFQLVRKVEAFMPEHEFARIQQCLRDHPLTGNRPIYECVQSDPKV